MSWTSPITWVSNQVVGASDLNAQVRDNMNYLVAGRPVGVIGFQNGSDYATTSTSFVDVDATNVKITVTLSGTRALVMATFCSTYSPFAGHGGFYTIFSVGLGTTSAVAGQQQNQGSTPTVWGLFTGLTPGSQTFKLQFRTDNVSGTTKIVQTSPGWPIYMLALEV